MLWRDCRCPRPFLIRGGGVVDSPDFSFEKHLQIYGLLALCDAKLILSPMMSADHEAAAHLRTIRALMERATVYRAISAPTALAGGILTLLICGWLWSAGPRDRPSAEAFVGLWIGALSVVTGFNFWLLFRSARKRGDAFASSGMKMAVRSVAPPLAAGFVLSSLAAMSGSNSYADITAFWILFYGLALLAMGSFAPRSLVVLGAAFFGLGLSAFMPEVRTLAGRPFQASLIYMAVTFGALHLLYAGYVVLSQKYRTAPAGEDMA